MTGGSPAIQLGGGRKIVRPPADAPWFKFFWYRWQLVARAFGNLLSRVVTTIMFVVGVTPFAIISRLFTDPLELKPRPSQWTPIPPQPTGVEEGRKGF